MFSHMLFHSIEYKGKAMSKKLTTCKALEQNERKSTSKSLVTYSQSTGNKSNYCPLFIISHIISTATEDLSLFSDSKGRSSNHTTCKQSLSVRQKKVKPRINCVYLYK